MPTIHLPKALRGTNHSDKVLAVPGRQAEASRNDELVLAAARAVLTADPGAAMADIARRAGVGIGTLYRRYPSKEALVLQLCLDGMRQLERVAQTALARAGDDAWEAFAGFMREDRKG